MRALTGVLLITLFCGVSSAYADTMFSGTVQTVTTSGGLCMASEAVSSNINLSCSASNPTTTATVIGSGNAYSGSLTLNDDVLASSFQGEPFGIATDTAQLDLNEKYIVTGGNGPTSVTFLLADSGLPIDGGTRTCNFTFDGATQSCDAGGSFTETVEFGEPFSIQLDVNMYSIGENGEPAGQYESYDLFSDDGSTVIATPEPSSAWLLMTAPLMAGVFFAAKRRSAGSGKDRSNLLSSLERRIIP